MKQHLHLLILLLFALPVEAQPTLESLLRAVDAAIEDSEQYEKDKMQRITLIKDGLKVSGLSLEEEYRINLRLYTEYEAYICDSARHYINRNIELAVRLNNREWLNESKLKKVHILATSGLYAEGLRLLETINKQHLSDRLLVDYYMAFENIYLYYAEYAQDDEYMPGYLDKMNSYRDSVLMIVPEGSYQYVIVQGPMLIYHQQPKEAENLLKTYISGVSSDTREYAILTSILAFTYQNDSQLELQKMCLAESAIADIKAVVKENNSLRALAELLYEEGAIERANKYMKKSMADASFYNARLRNVQSSKMLPVIDSSYQLEKEMQRRKLQVFLGVISILSLFLILTIGYVIRQLKKLAKTRREVICANNELQKLNTDLVEANHRQKLTNNSLTEANCIKEEYIGRFLGLCSAYIDKLETYRRMLNKKAASGKVEELYKTLKSSQFIDDELKEFYQNFDNSFLNIFPDFVECFNYLLPESEHILPKQGERLTTELRIFALIRLGIIDSAKIASFLRYSITTIYTYRSKLKNKSLYRDNFEEQVMKIGSFRV
ncbi:DUF6377 domain-containing protein [Bacteroides nordii]|uniref:DUF6377 domain-containing protein n=2 Tax=Bacteroides nordii TaxID=291645 RepID=UPI00046F092B|nr:DUF6377 domain-containing protein [Bacteroides nordii]UAK43157.1 DUF6377 domain-containing protein [Bacteroides nordii]